MRHLNVPATEVRAGDRVVLDASVVDHVDTETEEFHVTIYYTDGDWRRRPRVAVVTVEREES